MVNLNIEFNEEELYKLNIHELRDLARDVGMISPTTKSKEELVEGVLSIVYGEAPKRETKSSAGRPARARKSTSKLLFELDENEESLESLDNPFVKKYENNPESLFSSVEESNDNYDSYMSFFNPYSSSAMVASSKTPYIVGNPENKGEDNNKDDKQEDEDMSSELLEIGKRIRKLLGRERKGDEKETKKSYEPKNCIYVTSYVFIGAEDKLYIAYPEIDNGDQVIYRVPDKLVNLFAIQDGDYIEGWVDPRFDILVNLTAINGHIVM